MTEILVRTRGPEDRRIAITQLVIAGWTGRDKVAMEHHMAELEALGVARPARTPIFYRAAAARLTQEPAIEVVGADSSGEVEYVLVASDGALFVGVGSDHTDRKVETYGVTVSKQMCDKPIGRDFWPFEEVAAHWDQLVLRSHATIGGRRELYQEGPVARMLAPAELIRGYAGGDRLAEGTVMFGGTLAARGGIRPADRFEGEFEDPVLGRRLSFAYDIRQLPVHG